MADRPVTYYFGRLNLIPVIADYAEKTRFVLEALRTNKTIERRSHIWRFSRIGELDGEDGQYVYGFLVKYKAETAEEVIVPETGDIEDEAIKNSVVAKSRFFMHIRSGIVAYHPVGAISEGQFRWYFARLIEEAYDRFFVEAEVLTIEDRIQIQEVLRTIDNVSRIEIYLHPSNPNNSEIWQSIDKDLKETHTNRYTEIRETNENITSGEVILTNEQLLSKLLMSVDGYGETKIKGKIQGKVRIISTKSNPVTTSAPNDKHPADTVFANLQATIKGIFARFEK